MIARFPPCAFRTRKRLKPCRTRLFAGGGPLRTLHTAQVVDPDRQVCPVLSERRDRNDHHVRARQQILGPGSSVSGRVMCGGSLRAFATGGGSVLWAEEEGGRSAAALRPAVG